MEIIVSKNTHHSVIRRLAVIIDFSILLKLMRVVSEKNMHIPSI